MLLDFVGPVSVAKGATIEVTHDASAETGLKMLKSTISGTLVGDYSNRRMLSRDRCIPTATVRPDAMTSESHLVVKMPDYISANYCRKRPIVKFDNSTNAGTGTRRRLTGGQNPGLTVYVNGKEVSAEYKLVRTGDGYILERRTTQIGGGIVRTARATRLQHTLCSSSVWMAAAVFLSITTRAVGVY